MTGNDLYYDGTWLSNLGLIMYDPDDDQEWVERNFVTTNQNGNRPEQTFYGETYDGTLQLHFLIGKNPSIYHTQKEQQFTQQDIELVRKWLESNQIPLELKCKNQDSDEVSYFGVFQEAQPFLVATKCYGIYYTFQCNTPYAYSSIYKKEIPLSSSTSVNTSFDCSMSKKYSYAYPIIKIYTNSSVSNKGKLSITNKSDKNKTMGFNVPNIKCLILDTKTKQAYSDDGTLIPIDTLGWNTSEALNYTSLFTNTVNLYWLRLVDGTNNLLIAQTVANAIDKIIIETRFIRKADGFLNV